MVKDIYFDYDKADLRPDAQQALAQAAQVIKQKGWKVQIEGNCDDRGSTEYNLALGERRADSAKQALLAGGCRRGRASRPSATARKNRNALTRMKIAGRKTAAITSRCCTKRLLH